MWGAFKRKEYDFWKFKKMIYEHDAAIKMVKYTNET